MRLGGFLVLHAFALGCSRTEPPPPQTAAQQVSPPPDSARRAFAPGDTEAVIRQGSTTITIVRGPDIPYSTDSTIVRSLTDSSPLLRSLNRQSELLNNDTVHFYSAEGRVGWVYEGSPLDSSFWNLYEFVYPELHVTSRQFPVLFVAGRIALAPSITGYVLRVPGMYSSSELDLWLYDRQEQRFRPPIRVAEQWGDEGYVFNEESWLARSSIDKPYQLFFRRWHSNADIETDSILTHTDTIYSRAWTGHEFAPIKTVQESALRRVFVAARRGAPR
jgi:hypothetical protein